MCKKYPNRYTPSEIYSGLPKSTALFTDNKLEERNVAVLEMISYEVHLCAEGFLSILG